MTAAAARKHSSQMAAAARSHNSSRHGWSPTSLNLVLCATVGLMMATGFLLYLAILISPGLLRSVLHDVVQCHDDRSGPARPALSNRAGNYTSSEVHEYSGDLSPEVSSDGRSITVHCCPCESDNNDRTRPPHQRMGAGEARGRSRFRILLGVLTMASKTERRNLLRLAYSLQSSPDADVSVRFVMGALPPARSGESRNVDRTLVGMENATYGDILVLNCSENLNDGKTFAYFSSLPSFGVEYDYVMKTDDDSYVRFDNLARSLKPLSRTDLYYGYILPCDNQDPYSWYMAGMGYLISWDLVLWIRDSPIARNKSVGVEDQLVGDWFNEGGKAKHRVNKKPLFYDHQEFGGECAHELVPETILLHQVKTAERWADVLDFFEKDRISQALLPPGVD